MRLGGEIRRPFHDTVGLGWTMPRVLHVGPCNAPTRTWAQ
jgi:hypothetical protein